MSTGYRWRWKPRRRVVSSQLTIELFSKVLVTKFFLVELCFISINIFLNIFLSITFYSERKLIVKLGLKRPDQEVVVCMTYFRDKNTFYLLSSTRNLLGKFEFCCQCHNYLWFRYFRSIVSCKHNFKSISFFRLCYF